jgi:hypothetical protein
MLPILQNLRKIIDHVLFRSAEDYYVKSLNQICFLKMFLLVPTIPPPSVFESLLDFPGSSFVIRLIELSVWRVSGNKRETTRKGKTAHKQKKCHEKRSNMRKGFLGEWFWIGWKSKSNRRKENEKLKQIRGGIIVSARALSEREK